MAEINFKNVIILRIDTGGVPVNEITRLCRELRKNMTKAEKILWEEIRRNRLGYRFRRKHPVIYMIDLKTSFFIADFLCPESKLIIEVDGEIHDKQIESDSARDQILNEMGYRILRFKNEQVLTLIEDVIKIITVNLKD